MNEISILSIGGAVQDVYLQGEVLEPQNEDGEWVEEFKLGQKHDLDAITFGTGGGATNGAVTFARQGLRSSLMAKIGDDPAGEAVLADMKKENVGTENVVYSNNFHTGYSVLLLAPNGERTILTYRGASANYHAGDFKLDKAIADWFFITSMAGNIDMLEAIVNHAHSRHIKVALIPGRGELEKAARFKELIPKLTVLSANVEEMQMLFDGSNKEELARAASEIVSVAVVTDGPNGVAACDGQNLASAGMYEDVPVKDRNGAGDAFASGFVSKIAQGADLRAAITFGSANSTSVIGRIGAKPGILRSGAEVHDMDIHIQPINQGEHHE